MRLPEWSPDVLLLLGRKKYPIKWFTGMRMPHPATGITYRIEVTLPSSPPTTITDLDPAFKGEVESVTPKPRAPPGGIPGIGEELPIFSENGMRTLIQSAICERLSNESLDTLAYLVRRAYGLGFLAGKKSRTD